ncbi:MAG: PA0069 family radical SAM protein [Parvularculales bacterium]
MILNQQMRSGTANTHNRAKPPPLSPLDEADGSPANNTPDRFLFPPRWSDEHRNRSAFTHTSMSHLGPDRFQRGRGAASNTSGRFESQQRTHEDDGWNSLADESSLNTNVTLETPQRIISWNNSPDMPFDRSINPYRGCEHGCVYCFARPSHAFLGLSPGLDFETQLFAKPTAAALLRRELSSPRYTPRPIAMGTNTDPSQPIERQYRITRSILEVLEEFQHPVTILTKSALIQRDLDILTRMAEKNLVHTALSVTTLDPKLARALEPRASTPTKRMAAVADLAEAGVPTGVMFAPVIPALNDMELERIMDGTQRSGARFGNYVLLKLPREVAGLFREWLDIHVPDKTAHIMSLVNAMRQGEDYNSQWFTRTRGNGPYAWLLKRRFDLCVRRLNLNASSCLLDATRFAPPNQARQMTLL